MLADISGGTDSAGNVGKDAPLGFVVTLSPSLMTTNGNLCYYLVALVKNGAGIAGKDSEWIWILARDCEPPYPPQTF